MAYCLEHPNLIRTVKVLTPQNSSCAQCNDSGIGRLVDDGAFQRSTDDTSFIAPTKLPVNTSQARQFLPTFSCIAHLAFDSHNISSALQPFAVSKSVNGSQHDRICHALFYSSHSVIPPLNNTIVNMLSFSDRRTALALVLEHHSFEDILAYTAFAYCMERMTFPLIMTFSKLLFYNNLYIRDFGALNFSSTFLGHRRLPIEATRDDKCGICLDLLKDPVLTTCGHDFCESCLLEAFTAVNTKCPTCRQRPLAWHDTPWFLAKALWSYVWRYFAAKQTTSAISIAFLVLFYLSTDHNTFYPLMVSIPSVLIFNVIIHFTWYTMSETSLLCNQTPSQGYWNFRRWHFIFVYVSVIGCYFHFHK